MASNPPQPPPTSQPMPQPMQHPMPQPARRAELRVLHLEDSELDHDLTLAHLARGGLKAHVRRIDSEVEFLAALDDDWEIGRASCRERV